MTGFGFSGRYRIKKTDDFSSVFSFRKRLSGRYLAMHYMPNALGHARLGVVVGKKTARHAVRRNYMKRVLRELFRQTRPELGAVDILVRPLRAFTHSEFAEVKAEFEELAQRLRKRGH